MSKIEFLETLQDVIKGRLEQPPEGSYTAKLAAQGIVKVAQKVGEEGVELALAAAAQDKTHVVDEAADLFYHVLLLLRMRELKLADVVAELETRHRVG